MKRRRILILGLGGVGSYLAMKLAHEGHAITVIESRGDVIQRADGEMDVRFIRGDAMSFSCWQEAGASSMDYLIAVTNDDAVNILASLIADRCGIPRKVARVRSRGLWNNGGVLSPEDLAIDLVIEPEELAAQEVARLLKISSGNIVIDLAGGEMQVMATRIGHDSPLVDRTLMDLSDDLRELEFLVVAIARDISTLIPGGNDVIHENDHVYLLAPRNDISSLMLVTGTGYRRRHRAMIIGGGDIGSRIAELLEGSLALTLVEKDYERAEELCHRLTDVEILHGDGADADTLITAGLLSMDTVITATGDNETNIMTSVLAKHLIRNQAGPDHGKVGKTIALVKREKYLTLAASMGSDVVLNKKVLAGNQILKHIRRGEMLSVAHLHGVDAEVVELVAGAKAPLTKQPLSSFRLQGMIIGCVHQGGRWRTATGATQVEPGDRVIGVSDAEHLPELQRLVLG